MIHKAKILSLIIFSGFAFSLIERPVLDADEINRNDFCPKDNSKYGHTIVLIDTTEQLNSAKFALMERFVFSKENLMKIAPYDRLSIINLHGREMQASENKFIFSMCRPRNGSELSNYEIDKATFWGTPEAKLKQNWQIFLSYIDQAKDSLKGPINGSYSQILEQIKEVSRLPDFKFDDSYTYRKIIIVSDMVQNSKYLELLKTKKMNGKVIEWEKFKKGKNKIWVESIIPRFGKNKPEIELIYLNSRHDPRLANGTIDFWKGYLKASGIEDNKFYFEAETSFAP